ncbi:hypothetical protein ACF3NX_06465 [Acetobacter orientalis]|uniref:hypothetical protein n=1 Tax=Acetobacter orientalis TaxID=146474 RepID=UPI00386BCDED
MTKLTNTKKSETDFLSPHDAKPEQFDIESIQHKPCAELLESAINGVSNMEQGYETTRKGWIETVSVCVVLLSRQHEPEIREELKIYQSDYFLKTLESNPNRKFEVNHVIAMINAKVVSFGGSAIAGSAKTRLKQAVNFIHGLGDDLQEKVIALNEYPSFSALCKALKEDSAGKKVEKPRPDVKAQTEFARNYYINTAPSQAEFSIDGDTHQPDTLWSAVCRVKDGVFEILRLSDQTQDLDTLLATAIQQDELLKKDLVAEAAKLKDGAV